MRFSKELDLIFRRAPVMVCLSGELAQPGDYKTMDLAGVPSAILRGTDGVVRGFRNACAHRGAQVLTEPTGCGVRRMSCPYHGWSYDLAGKLVGVPFKRAFPDVDMSRSGLTPIQVHERCGMVFVVIENEKHVDIDDFLGEVACQFDSLNTSRFVAAKPDSVTLETNWKLSVDTFGESYHFPYVHSDTLMPIVKRNTMATDDYGPHLREVFGLNNIDEISDDRAGWADAVFGQHMYPIWIIFPNVVVAAADGAMQLFVTYPGRTVGECEVVHMKGFDPELSDDQRNAYEFFFDHNWRNVVQVQDFPIAQNVYRSLVVGSRPTMTFGTIEGPLHHLHKHYDKILSEVHI
ncbi:MAG TPA: aromatic ring-hydroxylating dioxygenase subunit alpha [Mycobacterium sp.]